LYGGLPASWVPSNLTEPLARGGVKPMIAAQSVDLPMPLRPMIATDSFSIAKLTSWRTCAFP
jgi:hypothetical protein